MYILIMLRYDEDMTLPKLFRGREARPFIIVSCWPSGWATGPIKYRVKTLAEAEAKVRELRANARGDDRYCSYDIEVGKTYTILWNEEI